MSRILHSGSRTKLVLMFTVVVMLFVGHNFADAQTRVLQVYLAESTPVYVKLQQEVIIPQFEALYPGVKVDLQIGNWNVDTVTVRYLGGSPPDVIQLGSKVGGYTNMLLPLNKFTRNWDGLGDFPPGLIDGVEVNGEILAIPFAISARTLSYRKDYFAESGLDPETPPVTWEDLVSYGRRLVRRDSNNNITRQAIHTSNHQIDFAHFLFQAGGNYMSDDLTRVTFADPPGMEAMEFVHSLFHEVQIVDPLKQAGAFKNGQSAMEYLSASAFGDPNYSNVIANEDIGVALPLEHRRRTQIIMPNSWGIMNTTAYPEDAWNWIEFSSRVETLHLLGSEAGFIPPRLSLATYSPWRDDARWGTTFEAIGMASTNPLKSPHFEDLRLEFIQPTLSRIFYDGEPKTIWAEQQQVAQAWLDDLLKR